MSTNANLYDVMSRNRATIDQARALNARAGSEIFPVLDGDGLTAWYREHIGTKSTVKEVGDASALLLPDLDPEMVELVVQECPDMIQVCGEWLSVRYIAPDRDPEVTVLLRGSTDERWKSLPTSPLTLPGGRMVRINVALAGVPDEKYSDTDPESLRMKILILLDSVRGKEELLTLQAEVRELSARCNTILDHGAATAWLRVKDLSLCSNLNPFIGWGAQQDPNELKNWIARTTTALARAEGLILDEARTKENLHHPDIQVILKEVRDLATSQAILQFAKALVEALRKAPAVNAVEAALSCGSHTEQQRQISLAFRGKSIPEEVQGFLKMKARGDIFSWLKATKAWLNLTVAPSDAPSEAVPEVQITLSEAMDRLGPRFAPLSQRRFLVPRNW